MGRGGGDNTTPSLLSALNFSSSTLSQSMCTLPVYTRARCLNVTTRSLGARCIHNSGFSLTSSSPLFLPRLLHFSKSLEALAIAFYISSLSLRITCQPCLPGRLEREKAQWVVCYTPVDLSVVKGLIDGEQIALAS